MINKATIQVTFPDGCRASWKTRPDAALARDSVKFAKWLREIADQIDETATTDGMCATKETADHV